MTRPWPRRLLATLGVGIALLIGSNGGMVAQTTTSTGVSVQVVDEGSFSIAIDAAGITFVGDEGEAPGVTAFSSATAYATVPISLTDTRSNQIRGGYEVRLSMGELTVGDGATASMIIAPSNIQVTGVGGLPEGLSQGFDGSASLDSPVTLFASGDVAPAVQTTIEVSLRLDIPAGTMPGNFSGEISIEVIPII